jgi:hypothetical protein
MTPVDHAQAVRRERQSLDDFEALNTLYLHEVRPRPLTRSSAVRKANREATVYTDAAEALTQPQTANGRSFSIVPTEYEECVEDYAHPRPTTAPQVATDFNEPVPVHPADFYFTMRPLTSEQKNELRNKSTANSQPSTAMKFKRWAKKAGQVMETIILKDYGPKVETPQPARSPRTVKPPKPLIIQQSNRQFINSHRHLKRNVSLESGKPHPAMNVVPREAALAKEQARKEAYARLNSKAPEAPVQTAPRAKRQVGHPDRGTLWEDFTTYVSPPSGNEAADEARPTTQSPLSPTRIPAHINRPTRKPVPLRVPHRRHSQDSEFEIEHRASIDSQFSNMKPADVFQSLPESPRHASVRRKCEMQHRPVVERRSRIQSSEAINGFRRLEPHADVKSDHGSIHTGYTFEDSASSASPTSWPGTPAVFQAPAKNTRKPVPRLAPLKIPPAKNYFYTFPVTYNLKSAINRSLEENRPLTHTPHEEATAQTPAHPSDSTRDEIESLRNRLDEPFDADDNSPIVDIREHEKHRSVKVQHRVDVDTVESRYWRELREEMDPAEKVWRDMEVEMRGAGRTKSSERRDGRVPGKKGGFF